MNELTVLMFEEKTEVRTLERDGETWWVTKDVGRILGFVNIREAVSQLDDDEKMTLTKHGNVIKNFAVRDNCEVSNVTVADIRNSNIANRGLSIINESGLYNLIFRSTKPEAKAFRKWVTSEVLPSIRRKGHYIIEELKEKVLSLKWENEHQKLLLDGKDDIPLRELKVFIKRNILSGTRRDWILGEEMYDRYAKNVDNAYTIDFFIAEISRTFSSVLLKMYKKNHMLYGIRKK
ncbi:MAG: hypothetical protein LBR10_09965 [Prevotellaceae bacterium]|jgi:prophage antirepressor-like protein|nr:hypothetical protein [Prevotellaceae bacterium]